MARLSGLQRQVLGLYRQCLREANKKPAEFRPNWRKFIREEFHKYLHIHKSKFSVVEHLLRLGDKRLQMYRGDNVKDIAM